MLDTLLLQTIRAQQTRTSQERKPTKTNKQTRMYKLFKRIDAKHAKSKILYFPQERRYCFPANIGDARNPLVFGKIPIDYQIRELVENARSNHVAGLAHTNPRKHLTRVISMNYKHR